MKVLLWAIGKTTESYLETGIQAYEKRIKRYLPFQFEIIPNSRKKSTDPKVVKTGRGQDGAG